MITSGPISYKVRIVDCDAMLCGTVYASVDVEAYAGQVRAYAMDHVVGVCASYDRDEDGDVHVDAGDVGDSVDRRWWTPGASISLARLLGEHIAEQWEAVGPQLRRRELTDVYCD
jgi:hypothetical protein